MVINKTYLDELTNRAKASPRLRMNYDLRNSTDDQSQRMLNAIEPGSPLPIFIGINIRRRRWCVCGEGLWRSSTMSWLGFVQMPSS